MDCRPRRSSQGFRSARGSGNEASSRYVSTVIPDAAPLSDSLSCFDGPGDNMQPERPTSKPTVHA
jgi:hypothetical protein